MIWGFACIVIMRSIPGAGNRTLGRTRTPRDIPRYGQQNENNLVSGSVQAPEEGWKT